MPVKSAQAVAGQFTTIDATGALVAADSTPTGTLAVNGVNNAAAVTITTPSTGVYKWACTLPTLTAGDIVQIRIAATISSIATGAVIWEEAADTKLVSDLQDIAAGALMGLADSAITAAKISSSALTNAKFGAGAFGADTLGASALSASNIATGALSVGKIGASAIAASNIGGSAFDSTVFKSNALGVGVLAASIIGASNIGGSAFDSTVFKTGALPVGVLGASVLAASNIGGSAFDNTLFKTGAIPVGVLGGSVIAASNIGGSAFDATVFKTDAIGATVLAACAITSDEFAQSAADKVWLSAARTLTQSAAQLASILSGSSLTLQRGDSLSLSLTNLGSLTNYSEIWFTVKDDRNDLDANSKLMVTAGSKLRYMNGGAPSSSNNGIITIDDQPTGDITVTVSACEMSTLVPKRGLVYDIQCKFLSGSVSTLTSGVCTIEGDITRAT